MSGYLTTHVLDTARGCPAVGLEVELYKIDGKLRRQLCSAMTNADGRTDEPMLAEDEFAVGVYELVFHVGHYFQKSGLDFDELAEDAPLFLDAIPIRFGLALPRHYHVPLLLSPFGYSTYRGS
jgi:5-hydroxyisourate hydrolase